MLYKEQNFEFDIKILHKDLIEFILERLKNYLKENKIRNDIIESSVYKASIDDLSKIFKKSITLNKNIKKESGLDAIYIYKRASNILSSEKDNSNEQSQNRIERFD